MAILAATVLLHDGVLRAQSDRYIPLQEQMSKYSLGRALLE